MLDFTEENTLKMKVEEEGEPRCDVTNSLCDSSPVDVDIKPGLSYIALISMAIQSSTDQKMLLSEIYQWISEKFPYYKLKDKSWRNSIRHNLSLNECFVKNGRSENGKGNYWSIHPANMEDFASGDFRRRRARRRVRKCDEELKQLCYHSCGISQNSSLNGVIPPYENYVPMSSSYATSSYLASTFGYDHLLLREEQMNSFHSARNLNFYNQDFPHKTSTYAVPTLAAKGTESTVNVNVNVSVCGPNGTQAGGGPSWQDTFSRLQTDLYPPSKLFDTV